MTNPFHPEPPPKEELGLDEIVAVIIAFGVIGGILLWSLTAQKSELNLKSWQNTFSLPKSADFFEKLESQQTSLTETETKAAENTEQNQTDR